MPIESKNTPNIKIFHNLDEGIKNSDVIMSLRIQIERISYLNNVPNIDEDIEILNKNIHIYTCKYKKSIVYIIFEIINTEFYNININISFDKNILDEYINNLNNIFKDIYDDYKFNLIDS